MYQIKSRARMMIVLIFDIIVIILSAMLANYYRHKSMLIIGGSKEKMFLLIGVFVCVYLVFNIATSQYQRILSRGIIKDFVLIVIENALMFGIAIIVLYYSKVSSAYSRTVLSLFPAIDAVLMFASHQILKRAFPIYNQLASQKKALIIGSRELIIAFVKELAKSSDYNVDILGAVLSDDNGSYLEGIKVVSDYENVIDYVKLSYVDEVFIVEKTYTDERTRLIMDTLAEMGVTVHYQIVIPELRYSRKHIVSKLGRFYIFTFADRMVPLWQLMVKRMIDIVGALAGCIVLLVLIITVGPAIAIESPGPIFFKQKRVGTNGKFFYMIKFRSMYMDAEERKKELMAQNEMQGLMFKMENDPRITRVGRFIRKTSLDEFPQFINVLKGDMSLVGTRPPTVEEFDKYSPHHKKRLSFKPGITGLWQVSGRNDITDFEDIVRLDVEYIDKWSIALDIKILLKTFSALFTGR